MHISFVKLQAQYFPLLLKWLDEPFISKWWDRDVEWNIGLIEKKYTPYTKGYKESNGIRKPIHAFIIQVDDVPIGYIQYYNKYDFPPEKNFSLDKMPASLAAIDFYIGEKDYIGKGIGAKLLGKFLMGYVFKKFNACFVDPASSNNAAIHTYRKVGFKVIQEIPEAAVTWMIIQKDMLND